MIELDGAARTAQHAAAALGVDVGAIANSLVFLLDGGPVPVLTSEVHRVDTGWWGEVFPTFDELVALTGGSPADVEPG